MLINPEEFARIFDNIFHNLRKYGDNTVPVNISYTLQPGELLLMVQNGIRQDTSKVESIGWVRNSYRVFRVIRFHADCLHIST